MAAMIALRDSIAQQLYESRSTPNIRLYFPTEMEKTYENCIVHPKYTEEYMISGGYLTCTPYQAHHKGNEIQDLLYQVSKENYLNPSHHSTPQPRTSQLPLFPRQTATSPQQIDKAGLPPPFSSSMESPPAILRDFCLDEEKDSRRCRCLFPLIRFVLPGFHRFLLSWKHPAEILILIGPPGLPAPVRPAGVHGVTRCSSDGDPQNPQLARRILMVIQILLELAAGSHLTRDMIFSSLQNGLSRYYLSRCFCWLCSFVSIRKIPVVMNFAVPDRPREVRMQAAFFLQKLCQSREMVHLAIDCMWHVFKLQHSVPRNDFCRIAAKNGILLRLVNTLHSLNEAARLASVQNGAAARPRSGGAECILEILGSSEQIKTAKRLTSLDECGVILLLPDRSSLHEQFSIQNSPISFVFQN
ncbi:hypothetical protein KSP40_PGU015425 [Platanthera guangdongensis]|uniref:Uncharacterized protein n=1 Tax=Platanthera guangdongensis TaxID=2320717 RepID=A0ABR2LFP3_9ASPA